MTTDSPIIAAPSVRATELRIIGGVSAAHFLSHFYFLVLPPVFLWVRADYGVSYTELGLAIAVFNGVSAVFQTPAGFLADRVGPYTVLLCGLTLEAIAFALIGLIPSYWFLVGMFAVAGLANTVYHPADYALLSHHVAKERVGSAFSFHTFSGILGGAVAPAIVLLLQSLVGWRGAFVVSGILGLMAVVVLLVLRGDFASGPHLNKAANPQKPGADWSLLLSGPILRSFVFFALLAAANVGLQNYTVVALHAAFNTTVEVGNTALTANMMLSAFGVLAGGFFVNRLSNHSLFSALGLCVSCLAVLIVGIADFGTIVLMVLMSIAGFANGVIMPSRDMIVREVTPPGLFGTVFGFVTTGFNVAGVAFPLVFGALMDHGSPRAVFFVSAACGLVGILTVMSVRKRKNDTPT
jgi:MFS transporter, FSR family, fosmidomycin resistance protein